MWFGAAGEVLALGRSSDRHDQQIRTEDNQPTLITAMDSREYDSQGDLLRRVRAQLARQYADTGIIELLNVEVSGNDPETGSDWIVRADKGHLLPESRGGGLELVGSVSMERTGEGTLPATVTADRMVWHTEINEVVWQGQVVMIEGQMTVNGDQLTVWDRGEQERGFEVLGNPADFTRSGADRTAGQAERLIYDSFRHYMLMLGAAELTQYDITVRGPKLEYFPQSNSIEEQFE